MLSLLSVRNIVLIDRQEVHFGAGLNVLSGETGAGKSILLAALGLALGYRADNSLLRQGCDTGEVSAVFDLSGSSSLKGLVGERLNKFGIAESLNGEVIFRRILQQGDKSRAFVNDRPVNVSVLQELGALLMEVQGHFEQQGLLSVANHRDFLDNFSGNGELLKNYRKNYHDYNVCKTELQAMQNSQKHRTEEIAYLEVQVAELQTLNIGEDEEGRLDNKRKQLKNAETLIAIAEAVRADMQDDDGLEARLQKHIKALEQYTSHDENTEKALEALRLSLSHATDAAAYMEESLSFLQDGEDNLDAVESRLFDLRALGRKHDCDIKALPEKLQELQKKLEGLQNIQSNIESAEAILAEKHNACMQSGKILSDKRVSMARQLDSMVMQILPEVKLEKASFATQVEADDELRSDGLDKVSFMVQSNPGSTPALIGKIASAGELSRFLLALRSALAMQQEQQQSLGEVKILVFDEVDSGIGGETAHAVGLKLKHLANNRQVILITHSAQAAAFADCHFFVGKEQAEDATLTSIIRLENENCRKEIARMLSGDTITPEALAQAEALIAAARG